MSILAFLGFIFVLLCTDIGIKSCIENTIRCGEERRFLGGRIIVRKVYNKGVAFNAMEQEPEKVKKLTTILAVILTIYTLIALIRKRSFFERSGLSLMTAGAWGNVFDRHVRGYVIDYLAISSKNEKVNRITFNLADLLIAEGVMHYMLFSVLPSKRKSAES